ncbi:hypothetical protein [Marinitoga sp. 38H-ov]|nr:hypothetical protein [Marinitoga sp. 38H-ov]
MWDIFKIVLIIDYFFKLLSQAFDYEDKEEKIKEIREMRILIMN